MSNDAPSGPWGPEWYRIHIEGRLDQRWTSWFDGLALTHDDGTTILEGPVADQAALHGLLAKVRDIGLPLLSVTRAGRTRSPSEETAAELAPQTSQEQPR